MPAVDDPINRYVGDPWDRQPNETAKQFARFVEFAAATAGDRSLAAVARAHRVAPSTIWEVAERWRWRERAAMWDADKLTRRREAIAEKETQLAERAINLALVATAILGRSLRKIADEPQAVLDPKDMPAWAKMTETLRKMAVDAPDQIVALTGPDGRGPVQIEEFTGLSPEQVRDRAGEMARSVLRLLQGGRVS